MAPDAGNPWERHETVEGFVHSPPNESLIAFAESERRKGALRVVDVGCGAGRNAVPLAENGFLVLGINSSWPMLIAAQARAATSNLSAHIHLAAGTMGALPAATASFDIVVAHGIWNLARTSNEFRAGVREAARVGKRGAALFLFTFSRNTLAPEAPPLAHEAFVFDQFSGQPQCFPTAEQLIAELARAGFEPDPAIPLRELNRPARGFRMGSRPPVIYEGTFRRN